MNSTTFIRAAASAVMCAAALVCMAQAGQTFRGVWYSPDMYIDIDFHGKSIPDPNSMDGDPCAGIIKVKPEASSTSYTIENVKVSGSKATATAYMAEGDSRLTFEILPDGGMRMTSSNGFAYVGDGLEKLPSPQSLSKASPFAGVWKLAKGDGTLTLNLHDKCILGEDNEGSQGLCYGTIYIAYNQGMYVDNCMITAREIKGNQAVVYYTGGRDGNKYRATLVYDPSTERVTVKSPAPVKAGEEGECYVTDGLVFNRQK